MKSVFGFTLIELVVVILLLGILALIAIPTMMTPRKKAFNASAVSMGRQFKSAEAIYFSQSGVYSTNIQDLLNIDKNLLDAPSVTFVWVAADTSGYTVNVRHSGGDRWYTLIP